MSSSVEEILGETTKFEKEYEWLQASELYEQALGMIDEEDYFRKGEIQEKIGRSLHRTAFQAKSQEEFKERMQWAVEAYEKAYGFYEKLANEQGAPCRYRCGAFAKYLTQWSIIDPSEKMKLLDECIELEEKALNAFLENGNKLEYSRTYNMFPMLFWLRAVYDWDTKTRSELLEKGVTIGETVVTTLTEFGDAYEIARARLKIGQYLIYLRNYLESFDHFRQARSRGRDILTKASDIFVKVGDEFLAAQAYANISRTVPHSEGKIFCEKALLYAEKTRDKFLIAQALDFGAYNTYWIAAGIEDPDQRSKLADEALELHKRAHRLYSLISYSITCNGKLGALPPGGQAEYYLDKAEWEIVPEKRQEFLEKAENNGLIAFKLAEEYNIPIFIGRISHILSRTLVVRSKLEPRLDVKISLLKKAKMYREKSIEISNIVNPGNVWNKGVFENQLADIKGMLAHLQSDPENRRKFLEDATMSKAKALEIISIIDIGWAGAGYISTLQTNQDGYGIILTHLYEATKNSDHLKKAIEIWRRAIETANRIELVSRIAELYWKIAKTQMILEEHGEAADSFTQASDYYVKSAKKIPQLISFYQDYSAYMQAWSEIERAKHYHAEKRYGKAKEQYEKAAELHEATERWNYLTSNYLAWARLDEAEDLSRTEQTQEARDLFQQAAKLFGEARESISKKLSKIDAEEEKQIAGELIRASDVRHEYCLGRVALEEARILDRQGDHLASSRKYGQAANRFHKVMDSQEQESDRNELQPIIYLCQAWEKMMLAEARSSPEFYSEAAILFEKAREHALDQSTSLLAQAHSSFCQALEAGIRFELTKETGMFSEAKKHIETATSYYLRAGLRSSSDYAIATNRLLDCYMYSYNAQTEIDPERKARFYQMAERLLQDSAGLFLKANHPEKSNEVRTILENIRGEKEIALSLAQLMHAPTIMQTTSSFSKPTPTHEQAVGLERFENADIQANLIMRRREVGVGEDLDLEIEMVNAGKAPAQLVKVEDIVIEGFELKSYPETCRVEDSYLDMKGRTLSPLKTQELKLVLKPMTKGAFELKPRILYLDEAGKYKSHEPEPVSITVQELGIRGWLRGPTR